MNDDTTVYIDNSQKALITVGVLGGAIVVAVIVAKIVDYCYDHRIAISDDDSDISESTRDLIRMRLALTAFKKKTKTGEKEKDKDDVVAKQRKIIRIWSAKAKESRRIAEQRRAEDNAKRLAGRNDQFIKVQEAAKDGKVASGLAGAADTLVIVSEKSEKPARGGRPPTSKPPANKDEKRCSQNALLSTFPARPELERTLTGLDSSTSLPEVPAVVVVCTSGNESVLPGKESTVPDSGAKAKAKAKPVAVDVRGAPDAGHSVAEPGTAALTDRSEGSKSPGPKSQGSRSPGPKSPGPKSPSHGSPGPKSPGPKSPSHGSPGPKSPGPKSPSRGSPGPKSPGPKSPSPKPPAPKTPAKSPSPNRAASPVKNSGEAKTEATSKPEENSSAAAPSPANDHTDRQAESAGRETPPEPRGSPDGSHKPRPTSSTSRRLFTVVRQKSQQASPSGTKTPQPTGNDSKEAAAAAGGAATASSPSKVGPKSSKPRPKSVVIKEDPKLSNMPPKLSKSVAVYGQASSELKVHKDMVSKKKAAVSPDRAGNAGAGKTARTKSAKS